MYVFPPILYFFEKVKVGIRNEKAINLWCKINNKINEYIKIFSRFKTHNNVIKAPTNMESAIKYL